MYKIINALEYESVNADPESALPPINGKVAPVVRGSMPGDEMRLMSSQTPNDQVLDS
jgi:hypothetical protein